MVTTLCQAYLSALNEGDLDKVLSLFTEEATVDSPLYGEMPARKFYAELFEDTNRSVTTLMNVFVSSEDKPRAALHFHYLWTLSNGTDVEFECVDVFTLTDDKKRFTSLKIIYDTYPLRREHSECRQGEE
ncbi:nuclear transport factor 2 family protein [Desulfobaculum bizertense]|uniref:SnoaL-like domain-containing protein n=1 Tax=Desulfobaculum bizertense DSM 18034 TaxID=1121442 RepID=A0A1T4VX91_9BACT|nr:nuclear transport factor 2 family protein [Desulfobaculum bizertense]UIJ36869.1 nuclear transport factor 2 family protein [Desulfobaculum bizertense]SKA69616.1 SnoaL-like domain-containing protein [Desulfobaculum bizertense DSM 18034]